MQAEFAVDGFEIIELVGFGPTGEVWRAREAASGRHVALKRLRPEAMAVLDRLRRDAEAAAAAGGRHVVVVTDVLVSSGDVVLVEELAAGGSLADLLGRRDRLEPGEAITMLAPVSQALATLHDRLLVHGDVMPSNLLFGPDGRPMLSDCGLAIAMGISLTDVAGIADYIDSDVLIGGTPTPAGDVYSLAAVGFAALAGQPPRLGNDRLARFCPAAPPRLVEAIEAGLADDPGSRPSAAELGRLLIGAASAEPVRLTDVAGPLARPTLVADSPVDDDEPPPRRTGRYELVIGPLVRPPGPPPPGPPPPPTRPPSQRPAAARQAAAGRGGGRLNPPPQRPVVDPDDEPDDLPRRLPAAGRLVVAAIFVFGLAVVAGTAWSRLHHTADPAVSGSSTGTAAPIAFGADPTATSTTPTPTPVTTTTPAPTPVTSTTPTLTPVTSTGTTTAAAWRGIVGYLDHTRAEAFATGQVALLSSVYAPGAAGLAADTASVHSLVDRGLRAQGFAATVERVHVVKATDRSATLRVVDELTSYTLVDSTGAPVGMGAARGARRFTMRLVKTPVGWRISAVLP